MSTADIKKTVEEQFEKATVRLHCVFCGDTMFAMDAGTYACLGCNMRQEIMVRFSEDIFQEFVDEILPEEIRIIQRIIDINTNLLHKAIGELKN